MKASMQRITTGLILAAAAVVAACSTQPEQRAIDRTCNASDQELTYKSQRALLCAGYKAMPMAWAVFRKANGGRACQITPVENSALTDFYGVLYWYERAHCRPSWTVWGV